MTLDEAIAHLEEALSDKNHNWSCEKRKQKHEQLLVWLKDYKFRLEHAAPKTRIISRTAGLIVLPVCLRCHRGPLLDTYNVCPYCGSEIVGGCRK